MKTELTEINCISIIILLNVLKYINFVYIEIIV